MEEERQRAATEQLRRELDKAREELSRERARADAEDVVQDTWLRWHGSDRARVLQPEAWLVTTATRLAIDRLRQQHARRLVGRRTLVLVISDGLDTGEPAALDAELAWLYRHAAALVFPSKYEGFGMPPLEAQALGCPVISSTAASLPEVLADTALYFDPDDTTALLDRLGELEGDPELAARLRARGLENARRYSWTGSAAVVLRALGVAAPGADYPVPHGF